MPSVHLKEDVHDDKRDPLVAIDERVISAQMITMCRSFLEDRSVQILATQ